MCDFNLEILGKILIVFCVVVNWFNVLIFVVDSVYKRQEYVREGNSHLLF